MMMMMMMISWQKMVSLEMFEMVCESTPLLGRAAFDGCQHIHFTEKKHLTENTFNCRYISLKKKKHLTVMYCIFNPKNFFQILAVLCILHLIHGNVIFDTLESHAF